MSAQPIPPPNYANKGPGIIGCAVVLIVVPTLAVSIRFWSRAVVSTASFWWDDWAILATLIFSHAFLATNVWWATIGLGKHAWMIPLRKIGPNDIANHVALIWYDTTICLIKLSALMLYVRIFNVNRRFRAACWVLGILISCWWIILIVVPWTFCHPARKTVDPFIRGTCAESPKWFLATAFINAFLDLIILVLPMPIVWRLNMKRGKKISVSIVFLFGYCSAFLSFARFIIIVRQPKLIGESTDKDSSWDLVTLLILSMLEAPFAILALCGPSVNQLAQRTLQFGVSSLFSSKQYGPPLLDRQEQKSRPDQKFTNLSEQSDQEGPSNDSTKKLLGLKGIPRIQRNDKDGLWTDAQSENVAMISFSPDAHYHLRNGRSGS